MTKATIKDYPPLNYKVLNGATTAPKGYKWYWNSKSMFNNGGFNTVLVRSENEQNSSIRTI